MTKLIYHPPSLLNPISDEAIGLVKDAVQITLTRDAAAGSNPLAVSDVTRLEVNMPLSPLDGSGQHLRIISIDAPNKEVEVEWEATPSSEAGQALAEDTLLSCNFLADALMFALRSLQAWHNNMPFGDVDSRLPDPPAAPTLHEKHLVIAPASGVWVGLENTVQAWDGTAWVQVTLADVDGKMLIDLDTNLPYTRQGGIWVSMITGITQYLSASTMYADTPASGTIGVTDVGFVAVYANAHWNAISEHVFATFAAFTTEILAHSEEFLAGEKVHLADTHDIYRILDPGDTVAGTPPAYTVVGLHHYPDLVTLRASKPHTEELSYANQEHVLSLYDTGVGEHKPAVIRQYVTTSALLADTGNMNKQVASANDTNMLFTWTGSHWVALSLWTATSALLAADTQMPDGTVALDTDNGNLYTKMAGAWRGRTAELFATEAALLVATPPVSSLAFAEDTNLLYVKVVNGWMRVNSPNVSVGALPPANAADGDLWFERITGRGQVYIGSGWITFNGDPIGQIIMYPKITPPAGFLLCDGSAINAMYTKLIALIGPNTPDCRGQFIRGGTTDVDFIKKPWKTGKPKSAYTGTATNGGSHTHGVNNNGQHSHAFKVGGGQHGGAYNGTSDGYPHADRGWDTNTSTSGNHNHSLQSGGLHNHNVTISGGGDPETVPDHILMVYHIRAM